MQKYKPQHICCQITTNKGWQEQPVAIKTDYPGTKIGDRDIDIGVIPPGKWREKKPYAGDSTSLQLIVIFFKVLHSYGYCNIIGIRQ